jgi:hypothetical protein
MTFSANSQIFTFKSRKPAFILLYDDLKKLFGHASGLTRRHAIHEKYSDDFHLSDLPTASLPASRLDSQGPGSFHDA